MFGRNIVFYVLVEILRYKMDSLARHVKKDVTSCDKLGGDACSL